MTSPVQTLCRNRNNSGGSLTTITATVGATANTLGNVLVAHVTSKTSTGSSGVTDSAGNTWVRVLSEISAPTATETLDVFIALNANQTSGKVQPLAANTGTVIAACPTSAVELIVMEWPGEWTVDTVNNGGDSGASSTTSPTVRSVTPSQNNSVIVTQIAYGSNTAPSIASGDFILWDTQSHTSGSANTTSVAYVSQTTAASDGAVWTTPNTKAAQLVYVLIPGNQPTGSITLSGTGTTGGTSAAGSLTLAANVPLPIFTEIQHVEVVV